MPKSLSTKRQQALERRKKNLAEHRASLAKVQREVKSGTRVDDDSITEFIRTSVSRAQADIEHLEDLLSEGPSRGKPGFSPMGPDMGSRSIENYLEASEE